LCIEGVLFLKKKISSLRYIIFSLHLKNTDQGQATVIGLGLVGKVGLKF